MKLNLAVWSDGQRIYDVPDSRKYIRINHDPRTNEIFNVSLVEVVNGERRYQQFDATGLLYLDPSVELTEYLRRKYERGGCPEPIEV